VSARAKFHCHSAQAKPALFLCGAVVVGLLSSFCTPAARGQAPVPQPSGNVIAPAPDLGSPLKDNRIFVHGLLNQFEGRTNGRNNDLRWDGEGWIGTDTNRLWFKSEGFANNSTVTDGIHEALYDRPIPHMRYFDAQAGVRVDLDSRPTRTWAAIGIEGRLLSIFGAAATLLAG
jgi:copper resistance protein B